VYDGLNKTGHKDEWGLGNWPGTGLTRQNPFNTSWRHDINVVFELVNDQGKAIGRQSYSRRAEYGPRRDGNQVSITYKADDFVTLTFKTVKAADISDSGMSIRVASVNGAPPEQTPFRITMIPNWEDNLWLLVENGTITGFRPGVDTSRHRYPLVIPATLWAEPVTAIGDNAFNNKGLSSVVISDSVTTIGNKAFANNPLRYITIGKGVTSIADTAFFYNQLSSSATRSVSIPGNVTFVPVPLSAEEKEKYQKSVSTDPSSYGRTAYDMANSDSVNDRIAAYALANHGEGTRPDNPKYASGFMEYYERKGKKAGIYTYKTRFIVWFVVAWGYSPE
jgi:hypothetical protein